MTVVIGIKDKYLIMLLGFTDKLNLILKCCVFKL
jgi:hypothetical protein